MNLKIWVRAEWDRLLGWALIALGAVFLVLGFLGVKDTRVTVNALSYIASGGLGGLFCLGLGATLLLSGDLHDEWRKLDRLEAAVRGQPLPDTDDLFERLVGGAGGPSANGGSSPEPENSSGVSIPSNGAVAPAIGVPADGRLRAQSLILPAILPLAVLVVGWRTTARTTSIDTAWNGTAVAVVGLLLAVALLALRMFSLRARLTRREAQVFGAMLASAARPRPSAGPAAVRTEPQRQGNDDVLVVPGLRRYHRAGCPAIEGRAVTSVAQSTLGGDMVACGLCSCS